MTFENTNAATEMDSDTDTPNLSFELGGQFLKEMHLTLQDVSCIRQQTGDNTKLKHLMHFDVRNVEKDIFEGTIHLGLQAHKDGIQLMNLNVAYAGLIKMDGQGDILPHPIVRFEVARFMFPFARRIVINAVMEAGFPPIDLSPTKFINDLAAQLLGCCEGPQNAVLN